MLKMEESHEVGIVYSGGERDGRLSSVQDREKCERNSSGEPSPLPCSSDVDLESGEVEEATIARMPNLEKDCRICHLRSNSGNPESGLLIELGCCCKDDLAAVHKQCAEEWFKIRGNKTCEICGSIALNVADVTEIELMAQLNEPNRPANITVATAVRPPETRSFWRGHRFLNFLLACMVFAFVISWLFHFNVPD